MRKGAKPVGIYIVKSDAALERTPTPHPPQHPTQHLAPNMSVHARRRRGILVKSTRDAQDDAEGESQLVTRTATRTCACAAEATTAQ